MLNDKILTKYTSQTDDFLYLHSVADPPEETPRETHHDLYEICIYIKGDVLFFIDGLTYKVAKGDILCINNRELHRLKVLSPAKYERILFHFNPSYINSLDVKGGQALLEFIENRNSNRGHKIEGVKSQNSDIPKILKRIESYINCDLTERDLMIRILVIEFLQELKNLQGGSDLETGNYVRQDKRVRDLAEYINIHLEEKITLDFLADSFNINKYHLCHLFKKETGFTIFEYISNKRIIRAKGLILEGNSLLDSCYSAGFSDYANFYKAFKKITGISPKAFLKNTSPASLI